MFGKKKGDVNEVLEVMEGNVTYSPNGVSCDDMDLFIEPKDPENFPEMTGIDGFYMDGHAILLKSGEKARYLIPLARINYIEIEEKKPINAAATCPGAIPITKQYVGAPPK